MEGNGTEVGLWVWQQSHLGRGGIEGEEGGRGGEEKEKRGQGEKGKKGEERGRRGEERGGEGRRGRGRKECQLTVENTRAIQFNTFN